MASERSADGELSGQSSTREAAAKVMQRSRRLRRNGRKLKWAAKRWRWPSPTASGPVLGALRSWCHLAQSLGSRGELLREVMGDPGIAFWRSRSAAQRGKGYKHGSEQIRWRMSMSPGLRLELRRQEVPRFFFCVPTDAPFRDHHFSFTGYVFRCDTIKHRNYSILTDIVFEDAKRESPTQDPSLSTFGQPDHRQLPTAPLSFASHDMYTRVLMLARIC